MVVKSEELEYNPEILSIFKELDRRDRDEILVYLHMVSFNLIGHNNLIRKSLIKKANRSGILTINRDTGEIVWKIPLYTNSIKKVSKIGQTLQKIDEQFIENYRNKFKKANPNRSASPSEIKNKIKILREVIPCTNQEILDATDLYLSGVDDPMYVKKATHFLWKGFKSDREYPIFAYLEQVREGRKPSGSRRISRDEI